MKRFSNIKFGVIGCGLIAGRIENNESETTYSHVKSIRKIFKDIDIGYFDINISNAEEISKDTEVNIMKVLRI